MQDEGTSLDRTEKNDREDWEMLREYIKYGCEKKDLKEILLQWFLFHTGKEGNDIFFRRDELQEALWNMLEGQVAGTGVYEVDIIATLFDLDQVAQEKAREYFQ